MADQDRCYIVRDDGTEHVHKTFPCNLRGLIEALEEARFRSYAGPSQLVIRDDEDGRRIIRRFDHGYEAPVE
jgi:hypothetical protein